MSLPEKVRYKVQDVPNAAIYDVSTSDSVIAVVADAVCSGGNPAPNRIQWLRNTRVCQRVDEMLAHTGLVGCFPVI